MTNQFNNYENMSMLWEIIHDLYTSDAEKQGKNITSTLESNIKENFIKNSNNFLENVIKSNSQMDLLALNKIFISNYVNNINNTSQRETTIPIKPIKIEKTKSEPVLITFEEIQKNRRNEFEETLKLKQRDFDNSMKNPLPEPVEFKVSNIDEPIGEMEELIARTVAQRNFEIEQIHNQYTNPKDAEKWLHPQETSLQSEKMPIKAGSIDQRYEIYPESNSLNKNSATLIKDDNKHVTWGNNITFNIEERNESHKTNSNIFSKLKIRNFEKPETVLKNNNESNDNNKSNDNNESNDNNDELMQIIKNLQQDVGNLKDNLKNINTILGQLLEKN